MESWMAYIQVQITFVSQTRRYCHGMMKLCNGSTANMTCILYHIIRPSPRPSAWRHAKAWGLTWIYHDRFTVRGREDDILGLTNVCP